MKKIILLLIAITIISCKNETKKESSKKEEIKETKEVKKENFPEELGKVFQTHGGINVWRKAQVLSFNKKASTSSMLTFAVTYFDASSILFLLVLLFQPPAVKSV